MSLASSLRTARQASGLSVTDLARLAKTSKAAVSQIENEHRGVSVERFDSLLRLTRSQLICIPSLTQTAANIATDISKSLAAGASSRAFRLLMDFSRSLHKESASNRVALCISEPMPTGAAIYDAALAGVVEFSLRGLPHPEWLRASWRICSVQTVLAEGNLRVVPEKKDVPRELLKRGVLIDEQSLIGI